MPLHFAGQSRVERIPLRRRERLTAFRGCPVAPAPVNIRRDAWAWIQDAISKHRQFLILRGWPERRIPAAWAAHAVIAFPVAMHAGGNRGNAFAVNAGIVVGVPRTEMRR